MVYIDVIYSETLFCDAWWQTTQVTQVHQVQPIGKEVTLQKLQHVLSASLCQFASFTYLFQTEESDKLYIPIINSKSSYIFINNLKNL